MRVRLSDEELKCAVLEYLNRKGMGIPHDKLTVRFEKVGKKTVVMASIGLDGMPEEKQTVDSPQRGGD